MRTTLALLLLTGTAAAQTYVPPPGYPSRTYQAAPPPPAEAPPPYAPHLYTPAPVQTPAPTYPQQNAPAYQPPPGSSVYEGAQDDSGARPGNDIGTGMSLPRSDKAGNINAATTRSTLAPNLPAPAADSVQALLLTARQALVANQTGAAQEALERAETRLLDRDIPQGAERIPDQSARVAAVAQARQALGANDINGAIAIIDTIVK